MPELRNIYLPLSIVKHLFPVLKLFFPVFSKNRFFLPFHTAVRRFFRTADRGRSTVTVRGRSRTDPVMRVSRGPFGMMGVMTTCGKDRKETQGSNHKQHFFHRAVLLSGIKFPFCSFRKIAYFYRIANPVPVHLRHISGKIPFFRTFSIPYLEKKSFSDIVKKQSEQWRS